jgi:hypothetical protein
MENQPDYSTQAYYAGRRGGNLMCVHIDYRTKFSAFEASNFQADVNGTSWMLALSHNLFVRTRLPRCWGGGRDETNILTAFFLILLVYLTTFFQIITQSLMLEL